MALVNQTEIDAFLQSHPDWAQQGDEITKTYDLGNFVGSMLDRVKSQLVSFAQRDSRLNAAAGQPHAECLRVMVASLATSEGGAGLDHRRAAELAAPNN